MAEVKMTKVMWLTEILAIVNASEDEDFDKEGAVAFVEKEIAMLEAKAEKAKARQAKIKAEGDELQASVQAVLTEDFQTADEIAAQVAGEEVTKAKVVARLTKLVDSGVAVKETVKVDTRKLQAYKLA